MCLKYNTNILVHDLAQKLNFYSKNNIFSGYLLEQNKSLKLKYRKKNLGQKNKSIKTLSEKKYIIWIYLQMEYNGGRYEYTGNKGSK